MSYVKVSAAFYLKDAPKGHLGLRHESWNFGNEPVPLDKLIVAFVVRLTQFYLATMRDVPAEDVNDALRRVGEVIKELNVEEGDCE